MFRTIALLGATLVLAGSAPAAAQAPWPARTINLLTPFAPGPGPDLYLRPLTARLSEQLGQAVLNDVRTGGGGTLVIGSGITVRGQIGALGFSGSNCTALRAAESPASVCPISAANNP